MLEWLFLIVWGIVGAWMCANARDRGADTGQQIAIFIAGFIFSIVALVFYLLLRPKKFKK